MRAPAFWDAPAGVLARALAPVSVLWRLGARLRAWRAVPWRAPVPVIVVGNLTAGGAGKTPLVAALIPRLAAAGLAPHVLSRGYGGRLAGPHRVEPGRDTAAEVGDEPLMLAALAPVWIARDRAAGARAAVAAGAGAILMDDGFQNHALVSDLSILAVDAVAGFGNGRVIPAGPLREPVEEGLARVARVVLIGTPAARAAACRRWPALAGAAPLGAEIAPVATGLDLTGMPVVAFAGIGRPVKFFATLAAMGAWLVETVPFADHHAYSPAVLRRLISAARRRGAMLVTTEKDAIRLPPAFRGEVVVVQVRLDLDDWGLIDADIARLAAKSP